MTNRRQYHSLHLGRATAALLIVLHHAALAISTSKGLWEQPNVFRLFQGLAFGVEFFFVLSGIVIYLAHKDDIGRPRLAWSYLWKRFRRIYPVYWVVLFVWLPIYLYFGHNVDPRSRSLSVLIPSLLLVHIRNLDTILTVAWTLFHEVLFYGVFAVLIVHRRLGTWIACTWLLGSLACFHYGSLWMQMYWFSPLHLLFAFGVIVAVLLQRESSVHPRLLAYGGLASYSGCIVAAYWVGFTEPVIQQIAGLCAAVMLSGFMQMERRQNLRIPTFFKFLGDASYSIYLVHMPVNAIVQRPLYRVANAYHLNIAVCLAVLFLAGTVAGCLCHVLVERPLLVWTGGRKRPLPVSAT